MIAEWQVISGYQTVGRNTGGSCCLHVLLVGPARSICLATSLGKQNTGLDASLESDQTGLPVVLPRVVPSSFQQEHDKVQQG